MGELDLVQDLAIVMTVAGIAGFFCQKIGLSSVVGFLLAGILIGPHVLPFFSVNDPKQIQALSQLGLVFLMFSIGLEMSLSRMRRMGIGPLLAVILSSVLIFNVVVSVSPLLGVEKSETLFIAGMMMASSSAIIGKMVHDSNLMHQPAGQLVMGMTVLEDLVAVLVLTFVSSIARLHAEPNLSMTLGVLTTFITVIVVLGLLFLPRILRSLSRVGADLLTITVAGLALATAVLAVHTGYSLALGAFLLGAIVAETPQRPLVERALQGMRDIFVAVFFVSIGMQINPPLLVNHWIVIVELGLLALCVRAFATGVALTLTGTPFRVAARAGFMLTPVAEFAFIIAQVGVASSLLPADFFPVAIGTAILTAFVSPVLIQNSGWLAELMMDLQPRFLRDLLETYQNFLERLRITHSRNQIVQLAREKLVPWLIALVFASGLLLFASGLLKMAIRWFPEVPSLILARVFWVMMGIIIMIPIFAWWRTMVDFLGALVELGITDQRRRPFLHRGLQIVAGLALLVWLWLLVPVSGANIWFFVSVVIAVLLFAAVFGRRFVNVHHNIGSELNEALLSAEERRHRSQEAVLKEHQDWDLQLTEYQVPDSATWFGKSLGELELRGKYGCFLLGIERQGYPILHVRPDTLLYPGDTLLLLGRAKQIRDVRRFFESAEPDSSKVDLLDEIRLESLEVSESSRLAGQALVELEIPKYTGVQIAGVSRGDERIISPGPFQVLLPGDSILVVGTEGQIRHFQEWIEGAREPG